MIYAVKGSTPETLRDEIVKWLKMNASSCRIAAGNSRLVATRNEQTIKAKTYQDAAEFIEKMVIEA